MLKHASHASGVLAEGEILFDTQFGYMFDHLCREKNCLLPENPQTITDLLQLGTLMIKDEFGPMVDVTQDPPDTTLDSRNPSIFTFLGQFIDHDITARTDRNGNVTNIANPDGTAKHIDPSDPDFVVENLKNGRRPQLDLDSVFGDGPGLLGDIYKTEADLFYEDNLKLKIQNGKGLFDLPRKTAGDEELAKVKLGNCDALIADARNDENLILSQLHAVFLAAYNKIYDNLSGDDQHKYILGRKLLSWAYQYIVLNEYLKTVCIPYLVDDTLANGPYYYNLSKGVFMPLEFSVAGFRFGHSMIRQNFQINATENLTITELLNFQRENGDKFIDTICQLSPEFIVDWKLFVGAGAVNKARKIDPKIVQGLFSLGMRPPEQVLAKLAQRNLLRGYSLSIPTGQSVAKAMQTIPLTPEEIVKGIDPIGDDGLPKNTNNSDFLKKACFTQKTPLWFYILQEAKVHSNGESLGVVGSRLVAETLVGIVKYDPNSYLNNLTHDAVQLDNGKVTGIELPGKVLITNIQELIDYAKGS